MLEFDPPKDSPALIALVKTLWPIIMRIRHGDMRVEIIGDGLRRFKALKPMRTIICPNHASDDDSDVLFSFCRAVGESFNVLAAWEVFHRGRGSCRWLQYMGCLSVVRDAPDVTSFRASRDLLVKGKKKIIIFPEGEVSRENDLLLPLRPGAVQIGFSALEKLVQIDETDPVVILPVAMKYVYRCDIHKSLEKAVQRLERYTGTAHNRSEPLYQRIRRIGLAILSSLEEEYNRTPDEKASLNQRIDDLRAAVLQQTAEWLGVALPPRASQLQCAHILLNALNEVKFGKEHAQPVLLKELHAHQQQRQRALTRDVKRVLNFIAISEDYVKEPATQEQLAEIVDMFEQEIFGRRSHKGSRAVLIQIGDPIDLLDFYQEYKVEKAKTIQHVVDLTADQLSEMLLNIDARRRPVYESRLSPGQVQIG